MHGVVCRRFASRVKSNIAMKMSAMVAEYTNFNYWISQSRWHFYVAQISMKRLKIRRTKIWFHLHLYLIDTISTFILNTFAVCVCTLNHIQNDVFSSFPFHFSSISKKLMNLKLVASLQTSSQMQNFVYFRSLRNEFELVFAYFMKMIWWFCVYDFRKHDFILVNWWFIKPQCVERHSTHNKAFGLNCNRTLTHTHTRQVYWKKFFFSPIFF